MNSNYLKIFFFTSLILASTLAFQDCSNSSNHKTPRAEHSAGGAGMDGGDTYDYFADEVGACPGDPSLAASKVDVKVTYDSNGNAVSASISMPNCPSFPNQGQTIALGDLAILKDLGFVLYNGAGFSAANSTFAQYQRLACTNLGAAIVYIVQDPAQGLLAVYSLSEKLNGANAGHSIGTVAVTAGSGIYSGSNGTVNFQMTVDTSSTLAGTSWIVQINNFDGQPIVCTQFTSGSP